MIITADAKGRTDSVFHIFKNYEYKYPIVLISWVDDFVFNEELLKLKDYVLVDYGEYGWNFEITDSHIWGQNTKIDGYGDGRYSGEEWQKFDKWVKKNPFKLMFKRELLKKDVSKTVLSCEYLCQAPVYPMQLKKDFNNRIVNVFQYWGRSNEHRLRIHSDIWKHAYEKGFQPCDNIYYLNKYLQEEQGEKWLTFWMPHYARIDMSNIYEINNLSKLSLSWSGAGFKCFRTAEAPVNSVMVQWKNDYAWSYDWDETNCILVNKFNEINDIESALKRKDLYDIYLNGMQNIDNYRLNNYIPNYIQKHINEV